MAVVTHTVPANALEALHRGNKIEAIALLRESTGLGLKEAKDVIDEQLRGNSVAIDTVSSNGPLHSSVASALQRGNKVEAIKLLRKQTGLGLKQAKDAIEASRQATDAKPGELAPGEVPRSGGAVWKVIALAIAALVAYYF